MNMPKFGRKSFACMLLAALVCLCGVTLTLKNETRVRLPYADVQLAAAQRMADAEAVLLDYVTQHGIAIEKDDLNHTGLIGPEWTELTTSLGMTEAKRTSLQPDFAALMVKYYQQAGLQSGDTVCCGMSGSFPGLNLAAVCAANAMDLNIKVIASYGSSMYGATRIDMTIVDILNIARAAGVINYEMLAVSPGGNDDKGEGILFPETRSIIEGLAAKDGYIFIDEGNIPGAVQRRLELFGDDVDCFVNVGGASVNVGSSPYTLNFPNGLVMDPPVIPQDLDRGLTYEYAARNVPVVHMLNVRGLAEDNGLPFDPVPLTKPGETNVYYTTYQSPWYAVVSLVIAAALLWIGWKKKKA